MIYRKLKEVLSIKDQDLADLVTLSRPTVQAYIGGRLAEIITPTQAKLLVNLIDEKTNALDALRAHLCSGDFRTEGKGVDAKRKEAGATHNQRKLEAESPVVYFLVTPDKIKIGKTRAAKRRAAEYALHGAPHGFAATVAGEGDEERKYHTMFAEHRIGKSEWFRTHPDILAEIDAINALAECEA